MRTVVQILPRLTIETASVVGLAVAVMISPAKAESIAITTIPAGTAIRFRLNAPLSSSQSKTAQSFAFTTTGDVVQNGRVVVPAGAHGTGSVLLAGHAGAQGHEGDLTLRLYELGTPEGAQLVFADQRIDINGRNRKVLSAVLGLIPVAGLGAHFIRGNEIRIDPTTEISTVLTSAATLINQTAQ